MYEELINKLRKMRDVSTGLSALLPKSGGDVVANLYGEAAEAINEMRERLSAYEDVEEQGQLVILPCKVGDKLYEIDMKEYGVIVCETLWYTVGKNIFTGDTEWSVNVHVIEGHGTGSGYYFCPSDFGKTVFLTYEAAKAALKNSIEKEN